MNQPATVPDNTAVRVALWRALHLEVDAPPHILEDRVGLQLVNPDEHWRERPDMNPQITRTFRASIVARARFVEDFVVEQSGREVDQYIILGAGLDTFAERHPEIASRMHIFEVDQPATQAWKRDRLDQLGFTLPSSLRFVPVNFEAGDDWTKKLSGAGFDSGRPAIIASSGVSMYLTLDAIRTTLRQVAGLATGSTLLMTYLLPLDRVAPELRPAFEAAIKGAQASGTPFLNFFTPAQITALAHEAGFQKVECISAANLNVGYFQGRSDGLRLVDSEEILIAST